MGGCSLKVITHASQVSAVKFHSDDPLSNDHTTSTQPTSTTTEQHYARAPCALGNN